MKPETPEWVKWLVSTLVLVCVLLFAALVVYTREFKIIAGVLLVGFVFVFIVGIIKTVLFNEGGDY